EIPLVYESLHERRNLRRIAGHLVLPLRLVIPLYRGGRRAPWLVRLGMIAYDTLSLGKSLPRHRMLSREEVLGLAPAVNQQGLRGGASYYDAQLIFAERLVIENVLAATAEGADLRNYSRVTGMDFAADGLHKVHFTDSVGTTFSARSRCIVNAAGPWVDRVLAGTAAGGSRLIGGTKGSHIVTAAFEGAPDDAFYVEAVSDGRPVFIIPWNGQYLIGTTDIRYDGDPRDASATTAEVDYLLATTNAVFPQARLRRASINYSYAGVRPLPYVTAGPESAITRRHVIHRHEGRARGLLSIVGGKLTTYRHLAEQTVDSVERCLGRTVSKCRTASCELPGGKDTGPAARALEKIENIPAALAQRLLALYGGRAVRLVSLCEESPNLATGAEFGFLAAEVVMAIRDESARNVIDIMHRRLMLGLSPDQGRSSSLAVAKIAAAEFGWSASQTEEQLRILAEYNQRLQSGVKP
ncbi:MAG: glycerol-3-phosphate dehydrogenase/oxidase, partial [Halioglobus sp.]|nr:glycerol-3-phosphate dehydrogenase/oxidase [Halioglobus sp.]